MVTIYLNSQRQIGPRCSEGTYCIEFTRVGEPVFIGNPDDAANFLQTNIPVGQFVEVRHDLGVRSCMNKPDLWQWTRQR